MSNKKYHGKFNNRSQKHRSAKPISKQSGSTQSFTKLKFDSNLLNISYEDAKARLQALLQEKAVFEYDSVLPSGRITSHYLDTKETLLSSYGAFLASVCILHNLKDEVEFVGGALMQAYPLSQAICQLALVRGQELDSFMVREQRG